MQAPFNILSAADERRLVMSRAKEGAQRLHQENPGGTPNPAGAIRLMEHSWNITASASWKGLRKGCPPKG